MNNWDNMYESKPFLSNQWRQTSKIQGDHGGLRLDFVEMIQGVPPGSAPALPSLSNLYVPCQNQLDGRTNKSKSAKHGFKPPCPPCITIEFPISIHLDFQCENGTLTEEICENGLAYDGHGNVYNHCNYNWAVDCGDAKGPYSYDVWKPWDFFIPSLTLPTDFH